MVVSLVRGRSDFRDSHRLFFELSCQTEPDGQRDNTDDTAVSDFLGVVYLDSMNSLA
jgi:hypothetical protein